MPEIIPKNTAVQAFRGLHLFHYAMSNCSQRVRMALCEKGLDWTSHHIDLLRGEQLTENYQGINPKGVVPTLVDNGRVIIDSADIIRYLEHKTPDIGVRLIPDDPETTAQMDFWIEAAATVQAEIRTITFTYLFRNPKLQVPQGIDYYAQHQQNAELVAFRRELAENGGVPQDKTDCAVASLRTHFKAMNDRLEQSPWLAGGQYSLADIAACVNVHRVRLCRLKLDRLAALDAWYGRIAARPAFQTAVIAFESIPEA